MKIIHFPKIVDERGHLTFIEGNHHIPFEIKRIFYAYNIPTEKSRGAHAHKDLEQVIICLAGSFQIELDDGRKKKSFKLDQPWLGLHILPKTWASINYFEAGTVYMVLASDIYKESDYYRDYAQFLEAVKNEN